MRGLIAIAAGSAVIVGLAAPAATQSLNWRTIASKTVTGIDTDRVSIRTYEQYRDIRLCVLNAPIRVRDFDIRFHNGDRQDVAMRQLIAAGSCTRAIDLKGDRRSIDRIKLRYEPLLATARQPVVRIQAR